MLSALKKMRNATFSEYAYHECLANDLASIKWHRFPPFPLINLLYFSASKKFHCLSLLSVPPQYKHPFFTLYNFLLFLFHKFLILKLLSYEVFFYYYLADLYSQLVSFTFFFSLFERTVKMSFLKLKILITN
jgi:hypothetical protein